MLMFMYDGVIFDGTRERLEHILDKIPWERVFPRSKVTKYPFKLTAIAC
jgi:hypothetical protein